MKDIGARVQRKQFIAHICLAELRDAPLDVATAPLKRFSARLAALICKTLVEYENILGLHIHTDS
jgi:hypothetical protein